MTALRELAERWKDKAKGYPPNGDTAFSLNRCADELLSILDAEGDGGAVDRDLLAIGVRARNIEITRQQRAGEPNNEDHALRIGIAAAIAAHPQPVRSDAVSDAQVNKACAIYFRSDEWFEYEDDAELVLISMRRTLEHFAKSQGESNA